MKHLIFAVSAILFCAVLVTLWEEGQRPEPIMLTPTVTGQQEYCLTCHADLAHVSPSHPVEVVGCVRCHGGERLALEADLAHSTLRGGRNPSDPTVMESACGGGACHSGTAETDQDHIQRITMNLHTTYAGAIAKVRYAIGAQPDPDAYLGLVSVADTSPLTTTHLTQLQAYDPNQETTVALQSFAQNCFTCHLASQPLTGTQYARFTGCAACHTPTANTAVGQPVHRLSTAIAYSQCNTCHNRGTYNIHTLQFQPRADQAVSRRLDYYLPGTPLATCEFHLDCVDCHTRQEIMGDGHLYGTLQEAQNIQCRTCHGTLTELPLTYTITQPDDLALRLAALNPAIRLQTGDTIIVTPQGEPLWNTHQQSTGTFEIIGKVTGQHQRLPLVKGSKCQQSPAKQEASDCHACHSTQN